MESGASLSAKTEPTGRETGIKLVLLALALGLVWAYAAQLGVLPWDVSALLKRLREPTPEMAIQLVVIAGTLGLIATAGILIARVVAERRANAATDALAKLSTRRQLIEALAAELKAHHRDGRQLALHVLDIDRFRVVNEVLGEAEGDALLRAVADRLLRLAEPDIQIARIGDDEFAVIQPGIGSVRNAEIMARRIEDTLAELCLSVPRHVRPAISMGMAVAPGNGNDPHRLLRCASLALREAKLSGGACVRAYTREIEMGVESRLRLEKAIAEGLRQDWFTVNFQPQYDLKTRRLTGFEALARLEHPQLGSIAPAVFLPVAEETGLIRQLGDWIFEESVATASEWPEQLSLAVNLSTAQFQAADLSRRMLEILARRGFNPQRLRLEISEAVIAGKNGEIARQLDEFRAAGITIVIDDFGISGLGFEVLARSPCDAIKIDRSFMLRVGEDPTIDTTVRSLINMANSLDLDVVAEGVERAEQAHFLMSNDCRDVQGYLFGRPAASSEVAAIIAKDLRKTVAEVTETFGRTGAVA